MVRVFIGLGIVALGLLIYCTVECLQTPRHRLRVMPKTAWLATIILVPLLGPGLWMAFGRIKESRGGAAPRKGPAAPDDDPEFLRNIEFQRRQAARREEEVRRRREKERKKAEQERRRRTSSSQEQADDDAGDSGDQAPDGDEPDDHGPEGPQRS